MIVPGLTALSNENVDTRNRNSVGQLGDLLKLPALSISGVPPFTDAASCSRRALIRVELLFMMTEGYDTGYKLKKGYEELFGIKVSFGTIYPLLHQFNRIGYLSLHPIEGGRNWYAITRKGRRFLEANTSFIRNFSENLSAISRKGDLNSKNFKFRLNRCKK